MAYTSEQRKVIDRIIAIGRRRGVPRDHILAALEAGAVESGYRNLPGGDADSQGWRQERASLYKNPTNLAASINRFYDELGQHDRGQGTGELAADVQRPAAQYRGRYQRRLGEAQDILGGYGSDQAGSKAPAKTANVEGKRALLAAYLSQRGRPDALMELASGLRSLPEQADQPERSSRTSGYASQVKSRAGAIDRQKLPYEWGGGHGTTKPGTPLDCSGAVSKALGIDARVSGQFKSWGKPGRGGKVTVYANDTHVLMEVDGHFWGTSASNPQGGAGWIPRAQVSADYLKGFTARHS